MNTIPNRPAMISMSASAPRGQAALQAEIRTPSSLTVLQRTPYPKRFLLNRTDRWFWVWLSRFGSGWRSALIIVKPETVIGWHRRAIRGEEPEKYVALVAHELMEVALRASVQTHLWIQGFRIPAGREEEIARSAIVAGESGVDVIAIWGIDACEAMSFLSCERPQVAWAAFLKAIAELRTGIVLRRLLFLPV